MDESPGLKLRTFVEFFDPYDVKHIIAAAQFLQPGPQIGEFPEGFIPEDVILTNHYGMQMHILNSFASCWILFKTLGIKSGVESN
jgi:hypothetical protein